MALIEWSDDMSVGVKTLDDDHKILMEFINELNDAVNEGKDQEVVGYIIESLVDYTIIHFQREEKLFEKTDYPDIEAHKRLHKTLADQVLDIQTKHNESAFLISAEVMEFLKDWLVNHIQGTDKKYGSYLNNDGIV